MKKARVLSILFVAVLLAVAVIAEAQQSTKIPRIGFLAAATPATAAHLVEALSKGYVNMAMWKDRMSSWSYGSVRGRLNSFRSLLPNWFV